ncbi:MFS transporter, YNFM family, putative membrane transport protein [Planifilum fulgidum]|jgi:YNFM family putative membrane transporter|uniref:MFS transporter, YNFM family, putative membrane transport protein n=1 Tax=Planifilum fulgidum TaxID=201973 RepID=A0A1I2N4B4_9BACL|nr:MFS transporter [Planifilum fulgidum]MBO2496877.1 MFS transporter [Bacillota bacterium]MBO2533705.1 MFS transporter [Thermoactinomycetaceae bacterium]SFF98483.1 MFS transporter, YNFM family, putative membrane transport protein [Planifilum fulgidum]
MSRLTEGTPAFRRANGALFAGGFVTFSILYAVQPLIPVFAQDFAISPAMGSLALSVTTASLALSMLFLGSLSDSRGRKPIMVASLLLSSLLAMATAWSPNFSFLLLFRLMEGILLAGLPAVAMAYLGEEIDPSSLGMAMGLYISGNSIGGLAGRVLSGTLTDLFSWRLALAAIGGINLLLSLWFWRALPPSNHFQPRRPDARELLMSMGRHLKNPSLLRLFFVSFVLMGSFVTLFNYIGFHLLAPPYSLSHSLIGWLFLVYLTGSFSSAWMGREADRRGRKKVLWTGLAVMLAGAALTLLPPLWCKVTGLALFTFGFFGSHSVASGWVGSTAQTAKAQAASLYLFFYYTGSSVFGTLGGWFWSCFGWFGVTGLILTLILLAFPLTRPLSDEKAAVNAKVS